MMQNLIRATLCCVTLLVAGQANADNWPSRPIKLIVPTGAGASTDVMARLVADGVSRTIGQPMFVENVPGASGILGHEAAAHATPDGYTVLFTNTSGMALNLISFKKLPYDPTHDFTGVALVCNLAPQMLSVNADLPVHSVNELIAYATANPGKLSIAFDNTAGAAAFGAKLFNKRAGIGLVEVPYRSAAQLMQDVAAGENQVMMSSITAALAVVQSGKVRPIAIASERPFPGMPNLQPIKDSLPGVAMNGFFAIVAPVGTPPDVIAKLNHAVDDYLKDSAVQAKLITFGLATGGGGTPETTTQAIRAEQDMWVALGKELNVEPQ
jgi:tripartite-type tricarboxylate transporter receptor subunit TctC